MDTHHRPATRPARPGALAACCACCALAAALPAHADDHPRVRGTAPDVRALMKEAADRSPLILHLLRRLQRTSVIVHLSYARLDGRLAGRLTPAGTAGAWRYLRIDIECRQPRADQIAALGHELQHALEIADAGSATDHRSLRALYGRIGFAMDAAHRRFESAAAQEVGRRIRQDLVAGHLPD